MPRLVAPILANVATLATLAALATPPSTARGAPPERLPVELVHEEAVGGRYVADYFRVATPSPRISAFLSLQVAKEARAFEIFNIRANGSTVRARCTPGLMTSELVSWLCAREGKDGLRFTAPAWATYALTEGGEPTPYGPNDLFKPLPDLETRVRAALVARHPEQRDAIDRRFQLAAMWLTDSGVAFHLGGGDPVVVELPWSAVAPFVVALPTVPPPVKDARPFAVRAAALWSRGPTPDDKRFVKSDDGSVVDRVLSLEWFAPGGGDIGLDEAVELLKKSGPGGHSDWRLPDPSWVRALSEGTDFTTPGAGCGTAPLRVTALLGLDCPRVWIRETASQGLRPVFDFTTRDAVDVPETERARMRALFVRRVPQEVYVPRPSDARPVALPTTSVRWAAAAAGDAHVEAVRVAAPTPLATSRIALAMRRGARALGAGAGNDTASRCDIGLATSAFVSWYCETAERARDDGPLLFTSVVTNARIAPSSGSDLVPVTAATLFKPDPQLATKLGALLDKANPDLVGPTREVDLDMILVVPEGVRFLAHRLTTEGSSFESPHALLSWADLGPFLSGPPPLVPTRTAERGRADFAAQATALWAHGSGETRFAAVAGAVQDRASGLEWAPADNGKDITQADARDAALAYRGSAHDDWRLPTFDELQSLYEDQELRPLSGACKEASAPVGVTPAIALTCSRFWSSDAIAGALVGVDLTSGARTAEPPTAAKGYRALFVRGTSRLPPVAPVLPRRPMTLSSGRVTTSADADAGVAYRGTYLRIAAPTPRLASELTLMTMRAVGFPAAATHRPPAVYEGQCDLGFATTEYLNWRCTTGGKTTVAAFTIADGSVRAADPAVFFRPAEGLAAKVEALYRAQHPEVRTPFDMRRLFVLEWDRTMAVVGDGEWSLLRGLAPLMSDAPHDRWPKSRELARVWGDASDVRYVQGRDGVVSDRVTGLQWSSSDNGAPVTQAQAAAWVAAYRGGGHDDWRLPTMVELAELYDVAEAHSDTRDCFRGRFPVNVTPLIRTSCGLAWSGEKDGAEVGGFGFVYGRHYWQKATTAGTFRALAVRAAR